MKHISALNKVSTFFQSKISKKSGPVLAKSNHVNSTIVVDSAISSNQGTLDTFVTNFDSKKAEIWFLKSVTNGFYNRANDELTEIFAAMFPDSRIAKSFNLARTKSMYTVTHGLAPYFKAVLVSTREKSDVHLYSFEESLNDVTQTCEMDRYVRFWESVSNRVKTRYFGSSFLGHTTLQDLCSHFIDVTKDLNSTRLYQISMDGPSVNIKFYNEFIKTHKCHHQLIDMGSCSLHIIHGALRTGEIKSEWYSKHVLKGAY